MQGSSRKHLSVSPRNSLSRLSVSTDSAPIRVILILRQPGTFPSARHVNIIPSNEQRPSQPCLHDRGQDPWLQADHGSCQEYPAGGGCCQEGEYLSCSDKTDDPLQEQVVNDRKAQLKDQAEQRKQQASIRKAEEDRIRLEEERKANILELEYKKRLRAELEKRRKERDEKMALLAKEKALKEEREAAVAKAKVGQDSWEELHMLMT